MSDLIDIIRVGQLSKLNHFDILSLKRHMIKHFFSYSFSLFRQNRDSQLHSCVIKVEGRYPAKLQTAATKHKFRSVVITGAWVKAFQLLRCLLCPEQKLNLHSLTSFLLNILFLMSLIILLDKYSLFFFLIFRFLSWFVIFFPLSWSIQ